MEIDSRWGDPGKLPEERRETPTAFVRPEGGGREWTAPPDRLNAV
ncbi:hypothetical protein ACFXAZ_17765 [Streptomyces sp. NPDC059477]